MRVIVKRFLKVGRGLGLEALVGEEFPAPKGATTNLFNNRLTLGFCRSILFSTTRKSRNPKGTLVPNSLKKTIDQRMKQLIAK